MEFRSMMLTSRVPISSQIPKLFAETVNGVDKSISEADLYRYTRQRWLSNEQRELAKRYLKFNLPHLVKEAVSVCKGARQCTKVVKCVEGLHNKAFILTIDNGAEVFAKLPNSNAGPPCYTTASEVATRQMLREFFNVPVPRVLAWSCDAAHYSVQAEYILEEKVPGVRLGAVWQHLKWETKLVIVNQVADFDGLLSSIRFKTHGCIYFKEDLQRLTGNSDAIELTSDRQHSIFEQYAMGPLTKAELWVSGREQLDIDRGPWQESQVFTRGLGANEVSWIRTNAKPRMNYYRSPKSLELPEDALELLAKYGRVASLLIPPPSNEAANTNTLWHPDLHLDNVFVDPVSYRITGIVDWQSAVVAPLFYQSGVHRAFRHHKKPYEQKQIDQDLESETIHKYYELQTMKRAPLHWDVLQQPLVHMLRKPVWLVTGVWENRDMFLLRDSLIAIVAKWDVIFGEDTPYPIAFSTEELELHAKEEDNINGVGGMLSLFRAQGVLTADGIVQLHDCQTAIENCHKYKEVFLNAAENEDEKDLYSKLWPYQEVSE